MLLNTSLNLAGEPIVSRAVEGYSTFLRCGIDVLVAGTIPGDEVRISPLTRPLSEGQEEKSRDQKTWRDSSWTSSYSAALPNRFPNWRVEGCGGATPKRWLVPLAIFLCLTGLVLIRATTVEALAPFIYSIW